jgi:membrane protein required for colicin V production
MLTDFDVGVSIIILITSALSFLHGAMRQILSLIGYVGAALITWALFPTTKVYLKSVFSDPLIANIASVIPVFIIALLFVSVLNSMIMDNLRDFRGGAIDRFLGLLIGLVKGLLIVSVVHIIISSIYKKIGEDDPKWLKNGQTYVLTKAGADLIVAETKKYLKDQDKEDEENEKEDAASDEENSSEQLKEGIEVIKEKVEH